MSTASLASLDQFESSLQNIFFRDFGFSEATESDRHLPGSAISPHLFNDSLLDGLQCGVLVTDMRSPDSPIVFANEGFYQLTGYSEAEVIGRNCRFLQGIDTDRQQVKALRLAIEQQKPFDGVLINYRKDGKPFWNRLQLFPGFDANGVLSFYLGIQNDVSEEMKAKDENRRMEKLLQIAPCVMLRVEIDDGGGVNIRYVSESVRAVLGIDADAFSMLPDGLLACVAEGEKTWVKQRISVSAGRKSCVKLDFRAAALSGKEIQWLRLELVPDVTDGNWYGHLIDITSDYLHRQQLESAAQLFLQNEAGIMITDTVGNITDVNAAFTRITGYSQDEAKGQPASLLRSGLHSSSFYAQIWQSLRENRYWKGQIRNRRKSGEVYKQSVEINSITDGDGLPTHYVAHFTDISGGDLNAAQVNSILNFDQLTGLPNRVRFLELLRSACAQATQCDRRVAVCVVDIDGFLALNRVIGEEGCDALLCKIADALLDSSRFGDTVARSHGDEFLIMMTDFTRESEVYHRLMSTLQALRTPFMIGDKVIDVNASVGCAIFPDDNVDHDRLLRHAGEAMMDAKRKGGARALFFDPVIERERSSRERMNRAAMDGLLNGEFSFYYQPVVSLRTGEVHGFEALARWQHPERGLILPGEFLPCFADADALLKFGAWTLREAFEQVSQLRALGFPQYLAININVDPIFFTSASFLGLLDTLLLAYPNVLGSDFTLEILESSNFAGYEEIRKVALRCRELGIKVALDDFGTGFSSLSHLTKFPVDVLKIDQSFIRGLLDGAENMMITEGVLQLTRLFGLSSVAEGVENSLIGTALVHMGCEFAQGFGIARPMPLADLKSWLSGWMPPASWRLAAQSNVPQNEWMLVAGHLKIMRLDSRLARLRSSSDWRALQQTLTGTPMSEIYGELCYWLKHQGYRYYQHSDRYVKLLEAVRSYFDVLKDLVNQRIVSPDDPCELIVEAVQESFEQYIQAYIQFVSFTYGRCSHDREASPLIYSNRIVDGTARDQLLLDMFGILE